LASLVTSVFVVEVRAVDGVTPKNEFQIDLSRFHLTIIRGRGVMRCRGVAGVAEEMEVCEGSLGFAMVWNGSRHRVQM
jgi:hypothetical protein